MHLSWTADLGRGRTTTASLPWWRTSTAPSTTPSRT